MALLSGSLREGNAAYQAGRYDEALAAYQQVLTASGASFEVLFDMGDAYYRKQDYRQAEKAWGLAASACRSDEMAASARYNQGNALYRQAAAFLKTNQPQATDLLVRAAAFYSAAGRSARLPIQSRCPVWRSAHATTGAVRTGR